MDCSHVNFDDSWVAYFLIYNQNYDLLEKRLDMSEVPWLRENKPNVLCELVTILLMIAHRSISCSIRLCFDEKLMPLTVGRTN